MIVASKPATIKQLFSSIASRYDTLNQWMTLGIYKIWNKALVKSVIKYSNTTHLLDLCAGTGAIAKLFIEQKMNAKATLVDFCGPMLEIAKKHLGKKGNYIIADVTKLPLKDNSFEAITLSYGIRNVHQPQKCIKEVHRILKPGGVFFVLELTRPKQTLIRFFHRWWLKIILPLLGKTIAKNIAAYRYLSNSIEEFSIEKLIVYLKENDFGIVETKSMTFGMVTLITAKKL